MPGPVTVAKSFIYTCSFFLGFTILVASVADSPATSMNCYFVHVYKLVVDVMLTYKMMIIFKKGNKKDLKNYRPICLLSNSYKALMKVLMKRLEKTLNENQPREQAGFRSKYSTTDHTHVVIQLKKCTEYNILCIAFVDYEKAFDSVPT